MGGGNNENVWWKAHYRGLYTYGISPFYQRAFAGALSHEGKLLLRGIVTKGKKIAPFVLIGYVIVSWANHEYHLSTRKNPADYLPGATPTHAH